jgi:hypothetical protein
VRRPPVPVTGALGSVSLMASSGGGLAGSLPSVFT